MASEPIPEPFTNQEVKPEQAAEFPPSDRRPELVAQAAPPIPADRDLPRALRQKEWKDAINQEANKIKQAASRAKETAARKLEDLKREAVAAASKSKDRGADLYHESGTRAAQAWDRARMRANYILDQYPVQVIAGVAAVAFVAGVLLRIWRSSRDA